MIDLSKLQPFIEHGYIKALPCGDLTLYNYTQRAQFDKVWTPETLMCRGLVCRGDKIVARPFKKFFNLEEHKEPLPAEVPELATKHDGSLLIVFHDGERWRAVTRGSFSNPQIDAATKWLEANCHKLTPRITYLFELVAPWNRIVVHYEQERMVLIGAIVTETGFDYSYSELGIAAGYADLEIVEYVVSPLRAIDLKQPFNNREGYVARFSNGLRVKMKFDDYKRVHAILSSASTDFVVDALASGKKERIAGAPDEFMAWLREEETRVFGVYQNMLQEANDWAVKTNGMATQKDKALVILQAPEHIRPIAFNIINKKDFVGAAWKQVANKIDKRLWRPAGMTVGLEDA